MLQFLKSKVFLKHLALTLLLSLGIFWACFGYLSSYTKHGETIDVPNLVGKTEKEALSILEEADLRLVVADSIFDTKKPKGTVLDQNPSANFKVKENRTIYITLNALTPPKVQMPNLVDASLRQAKSMIESYGLIVGKTTYIPDYAKDAVLKQRYKGKDIKPGTQILSGSKIDLVLGDGLKRGERTSVPNLIGLTRDEADRRLRNLSLHTGAEVFDDSVKDTLSARVYRQSPQYSSDAQISEGQSIDLFFTQDKSKINNDTEEVSEDEK